MIKDTEIQKFQTLWRCRFGEEIDRNSAFEKASKLVGFLEIVYRLASGEKANKKVSSKPKHTK